jgi:hypothetical protein
MAGVGYDPQRLQALRAATIAAAESLRVLSSEDPAAWEAVLTARTARDHLEQMWLPLIDRIVASDVMVTWRRAHLSGAIAIARLARRGTAGRSRDDTLALAVSLMLLRTVGDDVARRAFFVDLGGRDTARLFLELGVPDPYGDVEANRALAALAREELAAATRHPGLPAGFAADLVDGMVAPAELGRDPTGTLRYLFADAAYSAEFLVSATKASVRVERAAGDERAFDDPYWPSPMLASTLTIDVEADTDPTDLLLERLGDDAEAWRALLTDPDTAAYLLGERRFDSAGFARLVAGSALAAAGPDVTADAPAALRHEAAHVASAFVNHVGSRPDLPSARSEASASAATILGHHLFAVHHDVLRPLPLTEPGTMHRALDAFGPDSEVDVPLFDSDALAAVTDLAVDTEDGLATMRAALNGYEQSFAAAAATFSTRLEHQDPDDFLAQAIGQLGQLEAYLLQHAGHLTEGAARRRDEAIGRWVDGVFTGLSFGTRQLGAPFPVPGLGPDDVKEHWATHEGAAERHFEDDAREWTEHLRYLWFGELHAAGVIAADLPDDVLTADGKLRPWPELDGTQRRIVRDRMEENAWRGPVDVDWQRLSDTIKLAQQELYLDLPSGE